MLGNSLKYLLQLLYPDLCLVCGGRLIEQEKLICLHCLHHIPRTNFHLEPDNPVARLFYGRAQVEQAASFFYFTKGSDYQKLIHYLKYKGVKEAGLVMGQHFGRDLLKSDHFASVDLVCPVPLHPAKEKKRGYNQSWWIARGMADALNKTVGGR
jgi:predicted amidophosphoribosyltransferase